MESYQQKKVEVGERWCSCYQAPPDSPSDAREALRRAAVEAAKVEKGAGLFAGSILLSLHFCVQI